MRPKLIPWLILSWLTCLAFTVNVRSERLPIKIYTSADGLGSSFVNYLMRDSRGFMWFCTRDGLSRFDGSRFVTYRIGDKNAAPGIEWITETRNGTYWVTTTAGLYRFRPDALSRPDSTSRDRPTLTTEFLGEWRGSLLEDRAGNMWYGAGALYQMEELDGKVTLKKIDLDLPSTPNRSFSIANMAEAADGSLWINSSWGLIRRLVDGRAIFYLSESPTTQGYMSLLVDEQGRVWLSRAHELWVIKPEPVETLSNAKSVEIRSLNPTFILPAETDQPVQLPEKSGEILRFLPADFLRKHLTHRLRQTSDKHVWLTTDRELIEFDGRVFHLYNDAHGLPSALAHLAEDPAGNLWISGRSGLVRLDRHGLTTFDETDDPHLNNVRAITQGADAAHYFADGDFYLSRFDGQRFQSVRPQIPLDAQSLWTSRSGVLTSAGEWWILTSQKLYRFAPVKSFAQLATQKPMAIYDQEGSLKANGMFQLFEDSRGDIWLSMQPSKKENPRLARLKRGEETFYTFSEKEGFPPGRSVSSFSEDGYGNLWFGFYEGGMARFAHERFSQISAADGLPQGVITDQHLDRRGRLWLTSSSDGLSRIDHPEAARLQFTSLTTDNGLSSNNIRTITEDHFGNIYVGTVRGVDRVSPDSNRVKHYSVTDGLAGDFVVDSHCDKNGHLWFATTNGVSRLVPAAAVENYAPPTVWFAGLRVAGVSQALSQLGQNEIGTLQLSHTQNNLQLDFFGLDFHAGEVLRYQYKLEGADTDWSLPTEQRTVTFANLQPGKYRFLVRAINSQAGFSEKPALVSFQILPPIWLRWWFLAAVALVSLAIIYLLYNYRLARLREVNAALAEAKRAEEYLGQAREDRLAELERVRTRIATDLHDDIGASLTQISILSEVARQQGGNANGASSGPLKSIADVSNELVDTMSDIVWAINPRKDTLQDLVQRMRRFASDLLSAKGIAFEFETPTFTPEIPLGANPRREVFLIFKESLANIVKHSEATRVGVELTFSAESLQLKITDNGRGLEVAKLANERSLFADQKGGNGILSMKRRAGEMNGDFEIVSEIGKGTVTTFKLPLATTRLGGDNRNPTA